MIALIYELLSSFDALSKIIIISIDYGIAIVLLFSYVLIYLKLKYDEF